MNFVEENEINEAAIATLQRNDRGGYCVPNADVYPYQWNWDSALTALGFAAFNAERAWRELETLFEAQWDDGFVPHIVFWKDDPGYFPGPSVWRTGRDPAGSGVTQPAVAASVARRLYALQGDAAKQCVRRLFPKLMAWHHWLHVCRDPLKKGLALAVHPWETGRDNAPEWDRPAAAVDISKVESYQRRDLLKMDHGMRPTNDDYDRYVAILQFGRDCGWDHQLIALAGPFRVIDVGMTMIHIRADRDLLWLAELLNEEEEAEYLRGRIALSKAGVDFLWNDDVGAFCSYDVTSARSLPYVTNASFLTFYAGVGSIEQRRRIIANLERIESKTRYLLPSLDPDHQDFDSMRYWRGPVWAVMNYMAAIGFAEQGMEAWAERLRKDTRALIAQSGFSEAFCPLSGCGTGGGDFSWTAAMWLHWARLGLNSPNGASTPVTHRSDVHV